MAYELATPAIQAALIARLEADAALAALLKTRPAARGGGPAIYEDGDVYDGQTMPYLTIGLWTQTADHLFSNWGWTCTCQIKAISQTISRPPQVTSAVLTALEHGTRLDLPGYDAAWIDEINAQPMFRAQQAGKSTFELPIIVRVNVSEATAPVVVPEPTYQDLIVADGALAYWPLDDPSGTVARELAGSRPGTISGGVTVNQAGVNGSTAMKIDAVAGGRIDAPAIPAIDAGHTFEGWMSFVDGGPNGWGPIVGRSTITDVGGFDLAVYKYDPARMLLRYYGGVGDYTGEHSIAVVGWHHYVATNNGTMCRLYVDGTLYYEAAASTFTDVATSRAITLGTPVLLGSPIAVTLQDVAIYLRALTPAEILAHYTKEAGVNDTVVNPVRLAQLHAMRAMVDALIVAEEAAYVAAQQECAHPEDKRVDASTFTDQKFRCQQCGELVKGAA